jgi:BirA family transcriptional regulator, biotin operon repressor / biotin---[acetyl-CoA-carboxylase] ligase
MIDRREVAILKLLRGATGSVSLEYLSRTTGTAGSRLEGLLDSLQQAGFVFERNAGAICLVAEPDSLVPQSIMARLETEVVGQEILVFRETSSTNDLARQAGEGGAAEGIVFFAEQQTAGRGTRGRNWISRANEGLWFSVLLRSRLPLDQCPLLLQMAAVAAAETVECKIKAPVSIKAPNDLYLGGGKLGGFLLETSNGWDFQVLGIGINVRSAPLIEGYPAVALQKFSESPIYLADLAAELLNRFEHWYLRAPPERVAAAFAVKALSR